MAMGTQIQWCDATFNPWIGCTKVSDGCRFCYAERLMDHQYKKVTWGPTGTRQRTSAVNWGKPIQWNKKAQMEGRRYRVFCASLADVFEDRLELNDWRTDLFEMINGTPNLDWLLLTKRPENIVRMVSLHVWAQGLPHNVWLGTSVENQEQADKRIPELMQIPAAVRFLSMEPLLGPVDLWGANYRNPSGGYTGAVTSWGNGINWVIVGGESGSKARPMQTEWAVDLRHQCRPAGVAFFMKQLGGHPDKRHELTDFPSELRVRQFPV